ncbi:piggyBac transposable element-derived protein 3-like [Belonocnema kinseyi]|uniref:piggyBac transposable element-derived protein 3-like n=1 Tax=Belonocnema kinseyi TaxID=2817044 RepID=UPI00143CD5B3|nr:piggyBac transposable element-derived protein 3-like [Belonocnema kinseyi]
MVKYYGKTSLKQYMKETPVKFGVKLWSICNPEEYLFDCDICYGKGSNHYYQQNNITLEKCSLDRRVVLKMLQEHLTTVVSRKVVDYHIYFDSFFCNPDLLVNLKNVGVRATGTVRANRVTGVSNHMNKEAQRGSFYRET